MIPMAYLVDTDVLIDVAKGNQAAINYLDSLPDGWSVSVITAMELVVGARDKREMKTIDQFLAGVSVVQLSPDAGADAYELLKTFAKSHGLRVFDAIIAAVAMREDKTLVSRNEKHFRMIPELRLDVPNYQTA